jgi:hypothetical protein
MKSIVFIALRRPLRAPTMLIIVAHLYQEAIHVVRESL